MFVKKRRPKRKVISYKTLQRRIEQRNKEKAKEKPFEPNRVQKKRRAKVVNFLQEYFKDIQQKAAAENPNPDKNSLFVPGAAEIWEARDRLAGLYPEIFFSEG